MDINIKLNDLKYRYDVYQMFNIYFPLDKINFSELEGDYHVEITDDKVSFSYNDINREEYKNDNI